MIPRKTYSAKASQIDQKWYVVDLADQVLGRAATRIATVLRGKHKPQFTPHLDTGDFVIAINASRVKLTGNKAAAKTYHRHSGYIGNLKSVTAGELLQKDPTRVIELAVRGMLPKTSLGRQQLKKLKIYAGAEHPHAAQKPEVLHLGDSQE